MFENQGYLTGREDALGTAVPRLRQRLRERSVQVYPERQSVQGRVGGEERSVGFGQLAFVVRTDAVFFFHFLIYDF